jgi:serine/threonine protein phosphatase PrpC
MQGWRNQQEDSHIAELKLPNGEAIFGVFDGHGNDKCITILRGLNYSTIANDPTQIIHSITGDLYLSGSTMNFTTIEEKEDSIFVTNYNAGDSECIIFVNDELVFESVSHTLNKPGERERIMPLLSEFKPIRPDWSPIPLSPTRMTVHRSDICNFKVGESIVPTMSLGHNNMTGFEPDIVKMQFKSTDHVRIMSGSDGFWGMIVKEIDRELLKTLQFYQLMELAEKRWKQEWEYAGDPKKPDDIIKTVFPGYDDITLCIWDNNY